MAGVREYNKNADKKWTRKKECKNCAFVDILHQRSLMIMMTTPLGRDVLS